MDAVREARELIRIVAHDPGSFRFVKREVAGLEPLAASKPRLVLDRLEALRLHTLPDLALESPACDYARCVPVEAFWRYYLRPERRDFYATAADYGRFLEAEADPAAAARRDLSSGRLVPAAHSWLVPAAQIASLDGQRIRSQLCMNDNEPPYLVLIFPAEKMKAAGMAVREPRGLDAVPTQLVHWVPGDVPDERIDQDIPATALGGIEWRP